jgi:RNA polymerase sigma-70 factor (ECF subfamily)
MSGADVSAYHVEAAIAATHARAAAEGRIPWETILALYDQLLEVHPSPVVALNRAVAVWKVRGAAAALEDLDRIGGAERLRDYHLLLATRGRLLMELDRRDEAAECYRAALAMQCSEPERRFLRRKLAEAVSADGSFGVAIHD